MTSQAGQTRNPPIAATPWATEDVGILPQMAVSVQGLLETWARSGLPPILGPVG